MRFTAQYHEKAESKTLLLNDDSAPARPVPSKFGRIMKNVLEIEISGSLTSSNGTLHMITLNGLLDGNRIKLIFRLLSGGRDRTSIDTPWKFLTADK